jgi:hypothetical protein
MFAVQFRYNEFAPWRDRGYPPPPPKNRKPALTPRSPRPPIVITWHEPVAWADAASNLGRTVHLTILPNPAGGCPATLGS